MRILLIRHAESRHNFEKIITTREACPGLTETGFTQARALAQRLRALQDWGEAPLLISSPALRARQTAEPIAAEFGLPICVDPRLIEQDPGVAEGIDYAEYEARYGSFDRFAEPNRPFAPGGETLEQMKTRVVTVLESLRDEHPGRTVLAVTHGGFIFLSMYLLLGMGSTRQRAFIDARFVTITEWEWSDKWNMWQLGCHNA